MRSFLSTLDVKLFRDLWTIKAQAMAIMVVIAAGVSLFIMSGGMLVSLQETLRAYYERQNFADIYAPAKRAPDHVLKELADLPGVLLVEGRVTAAATADLPGVDYPLTAQVLSAPTDGQASINQLYLISGRYIDPDRPDEILLLEPFARARGLNPGDTLSVTLNGARRELNIVGLALSPEFIYALNPGDFAPDVSRVVVFWMAPRAIEAALDLDGAFNQAIFRLSKGAQERLILDRADQVLAPYGATGAYGRKDQISNHYVMEEINQLSTMAIVLPPIFLAVAMFLLNIVMTRMIQSERDQIGLLKAFGATNREIAIHYAKFVLAIALGGGILGLALGVWLGRGMSQIYQFYFNFPYIYFHVPASTILIAFSVTVATGLIGALIAVYQASIMTPAEAMRPPLPPNYAAVGWLSKSMAAHLDQPSRMILRGLLRRPVRAVLTCLGVGAAMALSVMMRFNNDAINYMVDVSYNIIDRSDITLTFVEPQGERVIYDLKRINGVLLVEPVRNLAVKMKNGRAEHLGAITGLPQTTTLNRPVDKHLHAITPRGDGIILSKPLLQKLGLSPGDILEIEVREDRRPILHLPIVGKAESLMGTPAYMEMAALNRAIGDGWRASGAHLSIDPAARAQIYQQLKDMPVIAGVSMQNESQAAFQKLIDEGMGVVRYIFTMFAVAIAVGVVYNSARIALAERRHELASLRVLGFTRAETAFIMLGELGVIVFAALPIGAALGYLLASYLSNRMSTELYQIPVVVSWESYGVAVIIVLLSAFASGLLVQRDVNRIDMVSALKIRE